MAEFTTNTKTSCWHHLHPVHLTILLILPPKLHPAPPPQIKAIKPYQRNAGINHLCFPILSTIYAS